MKSGTTYNSILGQTLRQLREKKNKKQDDMANLLGITQASWSRIERGDTTLSVIQLDKIAKNLGETSSSILEIADKVRKDIESKGFKVVTNIPKENEQAIAFLALTFLAVCVLAAMNSK